MEHAVFSLFAFVDRQARGQLSKKARSTMSTLIKAILLLVGGALLFEFAVGMNLPPAQAGLLAAIPVLLGLVWIVFAAPPPETDRETAERSSRRLITVATFRFPAKAESTKWFLEQQGLQAFLANANLVATDWFLGIAVGNVKLQVPEMQVEAALEILRDHPQLLDSTAAQEEDADGPNLCLECGEPLPEDSHHCSACGWTYKLRRV